MGGSPMGFEPELEVRAGIAVNRADAWLPFQVNDGLHPA
jgi:hypothetical protein